MRNREEDAIQRAVFELKHYYPELHRMMHIPNGGARSKTEAAILKGLGVMPDVSDVLVPLPIPGGPAGLWLELKAPGKEPTHEQFVFLADMAEAGYEAKWANSTDVAIEIVVGYVKRYRAARGAYGNWKRFMAATAIRLEAARR